MIKDVKLSAFWLLLSSLGANLLSAEPLSADQIIQAYTSAQKVHSEMAYIRMSVLRPGQQQEERRFIAAYRESEQESGYLVRMMLPNEIEGVTVLSLTHQEEEDRQYLYLPAIGKARPLSVRSKSEPFLGSDFTIQDLLREAPHTQNYVRKADEMTQNQECYVIRAFEKESDKSIYAYRDLFIAKKTFDLIRVDYFDLNEKEIKNFLAVDYRSTEVQGETKRPHMAIMTNKESQSTTTFTVIESRLNAPMPAEVFTPENVASWTADQVHDFIFQFGLSFAGRK